jgi:hypothetical protein
MVRREKSANLLFEFDNHDCPMLYRETWRRRPTDALQNASLASTFHLP